MSARAVVPAWQAINPAGVGFVLGQFRSACLDDRGQSESLDSSNIPFQSKCRVAPLLPECNNSDFNHCRSFPLPRSDATAPPFEFEPLVLALRRRPLALHTNRLRTGHLPGTRCAQKPVGQPDHLSPEQLHRHLPLKKNARNLLRCSPHDGDREGTRAAPASEPRGARIVVSCACVAPGSCPGKSPVRFRSRHPPRCVGICVRDIPTWEEGCQEVFEDFSKIKN